MIDGLVVIPATKPRLSDSSISPRFAESTNIFIPTPLCVVVANPLLLNRFPLHFIGDQLRMRDDEMPYHGLERLGVRRDRFGIDDRHNYARIRDLRSVASVAADYSVDFGARLLRY